jgi:hypothetical protein
MNAFTCAPGPSVGGGAAWSQSRGFVLKRRSRWIAVTSAWRGCRRRAVPSRASLADYALEARTGESPSLRRNSESVSP